jgi:hypothetical protein
MSKDGFVAMRGRFGGESGHRLGSLPRRPLSGAGLRLI